MEGRDCMKVYTGGPGVYKILAQKGRHRAHAACRAGISKIKSYLYSSSRFPDYGPVTLVAQRSDDSLRLADSGIP